MKLTLTVFPDGKAILAAPENATRDFVDRMREAWVLWRRTEEAVLIIGGLEPIIVARSVEIDLPIEEGGDGAERTGDSRGESQKT
jgi:hypothetical protein